MQKKILIDLASRTR